jgi:UDP-glucose 4-epimerase
VVTRLFPTETQCYRAWGWRMFRTLDRVYVNERARRELGWAPRHDFRSMIDLVATDGDPRSPLAREIGAKGYHPRPTGVYTR